MTYSYHCSHCHTVTVMEVPVAKRDRQTCHCGKSLKRDTTYQDITITVPRNFWSTDMTRLPKERHAREAEGIIPHPQRHDSL